MNTKKTEDPQAIPPNDIHQTEQSGGINVLGGTNQFNGNVAGRDLYDFSAESGLTAETLNHLFLPLVQAVQSVPPEKKPEAEEKIQALKAEIAKGKNAEDSRVGKLLDGILELVPGAVSAVTGMFATPLLSGIAGPVTKFVLDKIQGK
jgi:hypothetical protein